MNNNWIIEPIKNTNTLVNGKHTVLIKEYGAVGAVLKIYI